ncbi:hypothetical protein Pint_18372 [Pistacia integerrima]|uniref:Uncharacterized protein n=1 Tax=Pistacia integerrima TaxID=434235 RepID=A0ACC0YTT6_9ROSI|nr:hypothetical protein Pint_18372 [Pistacia integerrima]
MDINGVPMYRVNKKLKLLKPQFRAINRAQGKLSQNLAVLRSEVESIQQALDQDPFNNVLREQEVIFSRAFRNALLDEERFLKQKAKVHWLSLEIGIQRDFVEGPEMVEEFLFSLEIFSTLVIKLISRDELRMAILSIGDDKASRPDGFSSKKIKATWCIIGNEFTKALMDLF